MPNEATPIPPAPGVGIRQIKDAPFCWQHKPALRLIRDSFDTEKTVASALGVYLALTEIASDKESEIFETTHGWLAQKSGLSARTVQNRLAGLSQIGLVKVSTPALKSPSTYRLLPVPQSLPNDKQPKPCARQSRKTNSLPSLEQIEKKGLKTFSTKASKLSKPQKELADRIEAVLAKQWVNDAGKWINRIKTEFRKSERVIAEVISAKNENRINSTPAQYAENIWGEFSE
jgi:hypothetical protein